MKVWLLQDHRKGQRSEIACHKPWRLSARTNRRSRKPRKTKRRSIPKSLAPCEFFSEVFHQVAYPCISKILKMDGFSSPIPWQLIISWHDHTISYPLIIINRFSHWDCIHFPSYLQGGLAVTRCGLASSQRNNDKREDAQSHQREVHPEPHVLQTADSMSGYALKLNTFWNHCLASYIKSTT